jgi:hypothetical protein
VLQPAVNLESLVITGGGGCVDAQCFDELATFPRLAALSLRNMIWEDDTNGQGDMVPLEVIVCHQKTLKKLELHNCAVNIRGSQHCSWTDIYKRLANTLTGLVELKVEFELEEDEIPYVSFDEYSSYDYLKKVDLKGRARDTDPAQDALALEEFRAVVKSQRMGGGSGLRL